MNKIKNYKPTLVKKRIVEDENGKFVEKDLIHEKRVGFEEDEEERRYVVNPEGKSKKKGGKRNSGGVRFK